MTANRLTVIRRITCWSMPYPSALENTPTTRQETSNVGDPHRSAARGADRGEGDRSDAEAEREPGHAPVEPGDTRAPTTMYSAHIIGARRMNTRPSEFAAGLETGEDQHPDNGQAEARERSLWCECAMRPR